MKTPIKSFVVEVKRSRLNIPVPSTARSEPFLPIEAAASSPAEQVSAARQQAEQLFKVLLSAPTPSERAAPTPENMFGRMSKTQDRQAPALPPVAEPVQTTETAVDAGRVEAKAPARPVRKRASSKTLEVATGRTVVGRSAAKAVPVLAPPKRAAEASPALPDRVDVERAMTFPSGAVEAIASSPRRGWKPGERWKRRLRHLR